MKNHVFISAVILLSREPKRLAEFYREAFAIPLGDDQHDDPSVDPHFECELGDLHFAVHPLANAEPPAPSQSIKFALAIEDLDALLARLHELGVVPLYQPVDRGFARMTAIRDPDGNLVELTQLSSSWIQYLASRAKEERDVTLSMTSTAGS